MDTKRQEGLEDNTPIIRAFFLTVEDRGSGPEYTLLCPRCYSKTYWRVADQLPKRCVECGKVLTIRIPLPKKEEEKDD